MPSLINTRPITLGKNPYNSVLNQPTIRHKNINLNQNYASYKVLREQITDKLQEFVVTLDNPHSSLNRFIKGLRAKYGFEQTQKLTQMINKMYDNMDKALITSNTDSEIFFENMRDFTKNLNDLSSEVTNYLSYSDAIDEFNPTEANYSLIRFTNDFNMLDKAESGFPKQFRNAFVNEMSKSNS